MVSLSLHLLLSISLLAKESKHHNVKPENEIPFTMIPTLKDVDYAGDFDFVSLAQSPNYTPQNADFIMDIFREYIEEV